MSTTNLRDILASETDRILDLSRSWQQILDKNVDDIPEEFAGRIRAQIGLSKLLVNDKFQQFVRLLDTYDCGNPDVPHKMNISDLEGFWDLIYIQVEDTIKKFHALSALQENKWREVGEKAARKKRRQPLTSIANKKSGAATELGGEARKRLAEAKLRVQQSNIASSKYTDENSSAGKRP